MYISDKQIKTIQTSQLKGTLELIIKTSEKIREELKERGEK